MSRLALLMLLCVAVAATVTAVSSAATKPVTFRAAHDRGLICAQKLGADTITQIGDGRVSAEWAIDGAYGWMFWKYEAPIGTLSFTHDLPASVKAKVTRCLTG